MTILTIPLFMRSIKEEVHKYIKNFWNQEQLIMLERKYENFSEKTTIDEVVSNIHKYLSPPKIANFKEY